jgi:hypothetical protein
VSLLARATPQLRTQAFYKDREPHRPKNAARPEHPAKLTPAGALAQAHGPGPEGAAELFALKVASGLFGRDIARRARPWGKAVHLAYGTLWGALYGILQGPARRRALLSGPAHGAFVWALGPGWLVPSMKLMHPPTQIPRHQALLNILGHLLYGTALAKLFDTQLSQRR